VSNRSFVLSARGVIRPDWQVRARGMSLSSPLRPPWRSTIRPDLTAELSEEDQRHLASLVDAARLQRRREFDEALEEATRHLPRLVRGPAKKILFGGGA